MAPWGVNPQQNQSGWGMGGVPNSLMNAWGAAPGQAPQFNQGAAFNPAAAGMAASQSGAWAPQGGPGSSGSPGMSQSPMAASLMQQVMPQASASPGAQEMERGGLAGELNNPSQPPPPQDQMAMAAQRAAPMFSNGLKNAMGGMQGAMGQYNSPHGGMPQDPNQAYGQGGWSGPQNPQADQPAGQFGYASGYPGKMATQQSQMRMGGMIGQPQGGWGMNGMQPQGGWGMGGGMGGMRGPMGGSMSMGPNPQAVQQQGDRQNLMARLQQRGNPYANASMGQPPRGSPTYQQPAYQAQPNSLI